MREAMDQGYWVIADLPKGELGNQSLTLASLLFTMTRNAIFARERRSLFTIYCDEIQNLVAYDSGLDGGGASAEEAAVHVVDEEPGEES